MFEEAKKTIREDCYYSRAIECCWEWEGNSDWEVLLAIVWETKIRIGAGAGVFQLGRNRDIWSIIGVGLDLKIEEELEWLSLCSYSGEV